MLDCFCGAGRLLSLQMARSALDRRGSRSLRNPHTRKRLFATRTSGRSWFRTSASTSVRSGRAPSSASHAQRPDARISALHPGPLPRTPSTATPGFTASSRGGWCMSAPSMPRSPSATSSRSRLSSARRSAPARTLPTTKSVDVLGWDFAFELNEVARQDAAKAGIDMRFVRIPREVLDKRAVEQGDIRFFELALSPSTSRQTRHDGHADASPTSSSRSTTCPRTSSGPSRNWSQWIDYWAVDWDNQGDTFHNEWQSYRTRKSRRPRTRPRSTSMRTPGTTRSSSRSSTSSATTRPRRFTVKVPGRAS